MIKDRDNRIELRQKKKMKMSCEKRKREEMNIKKTRQQKVKNKKPNLNGPLGPIPERMLTLKQFKDVIADIQFQKVKFDKKSMESKLPRQTMEQYMFTYLN